MPAPKPGDVWRANFLTNRRTPQPRLDAWAYWTKWRDGANNGRLIFGGLAQPYFSYRYGWKEAWEGRGVWLGVWVDRKDQRRLEVLMNLYRRDIGAGGGASFHRELQALCDHATGEAATHAGLEADVQRVLSSYELVEGRGDKPWMKQLPDPSFSVMWGPRFHVTRSGDYLAAYYVRDVTDPSHPVPVAGGLVPMRFREGVVAKLTPYLLTRHSVVLTADLRGMQDAAKRGRKLRGFVTAPESAQPLAEALMDYAGQQQADIEVSVSALPVGKYTAHVQLLDASAGVLSETAVPFARREEPDWWANRERYGTQPEVPQPWSPIVWDGRTAKVWGREITFGESPLPEKIVVLGQDILAAPVRLELKTGDKVADWLREQTRVMGQRPGVVTLEGRQQAAGVRVATRTQFEFDGFALVDLDIAPANGKAEVEQLDLVITLRAEHAPFLTNYRPAPGPGPVTFGRHVGKTPPHYESPVMLTTWLGTDDYGLEWSCESSRDWSLALPAKAIEVDRRGDVVEARFHLIDHAITLERTRRIRFGLVPTPTKPVPPERYNWRIEGTGGSPPPLPGKTRVEGAIATEEDLRRYREAYRDIDVAAMLLPLDWSGYAVWHPRVTSQEVAARVREQVRMMRDLRVRGLWNGGWGVAPYAPEWDPWGKEMVAWPIEPTFQNQFVGSYASPYTEFLVGSFALNARELGLQGVRFDTVVPWKESANPYLSETWTADDGKTYGTQNLFRQRECFKRLYRIFHGGEVPDGLIYLPLAGPPIMAVESFVDIHESGESLYMHAASLKEGYSQDSMPVWIVGRPYGLLAVHNIKGSPLKPNNRIGAVLACGGSPRMMSRPGVDRATYEAHPTFMPTHKLWEAWSWIDRGTAQWWPHWKNSALIRVTGTGEHYASLYLQPGRRILLVVTNYEQSAQEVTVQLQKQMLDFANGVTLEARDAVTGEAVAVDPETRLRLNIGPELYRLVRIGARAELDGPDLARTK